MLKFQLYLPEGNRDRKLWWARNTPHGYRFK